jgi:hypothetical protein
VKNKLGILSFRICNSWRSYGLCPLLSLLFFLFYLIIFGLVSSLLLPFLSKKKWLVVINLESISHVYMVCFH